VLICLLRFVGEDWWVSNVLLYLPRIVLAAPLLLFIPGLAYFSARSLMISQVIAGVLVLFPLMGLVLPHVASASGRPHVRILTCNVNSGYGGYEEIVRRIATVSPDILVLQELFVDAQKAASLLQPSFEHVQISTQFLIASRFPLQSTVNPEPLDFAGKKRSPRFMQYVLETNIGSLVVYSSHPISPREAFASLRGQGFRREIASGRLLSSSAHANDIGVQSALRELQIRTVADSALLERRSVVVAGDLNLPVLSHVFARHLARWQDGFEASGEGFGYTFPNKKNLPPWMRLDRILASNDLHFDAFGVLDVPSDHRCVYADLSREER
jgi:endonuclease/exonuclease/phosphatase family metal-dependent hydrolase